jgi:hypothetical protein
VFSKRISFQSETSWDFRPFFPNLVAEGIGLKGRGNRREGSKKFFDSLKNNIFSVPSVFMFDNCG